MSLRLEPSAAVRERRLAHLLAERGLGRDDPRLVSLVEDALLVGSLELAGAPVTWDEARGAGGAMVPPPVLALRRALRAVAPEERVTLGVVNTWHTALAGPVGFRRREVADSGGEIGAPCAFIEDRLSSLFEWLEAAGSAELQPEQKAAVALARLVEIRPFEDANGRVARLAAAHLLARARLGPPILVGGDGPRLRETLKAAFRLETGPLVELIREASGRALAVMIQSLERGLV